MASRQGIKSRIKSVTNTKQITKAMQLVAASKLRKAQESTFGPRRYLEATKKLVSELAVTSAAVNSPLFNSHNKSKNKLTIVISSDRGLAGAYNSNVVRALVKHLRDGDGYHKVISVGRYASLFVAKINGKDDAYNLKDVDEISAFPLQVIDTYVELVEPILKEAVDAFIKHQVGEVYVVYTKFVSTVKQETSIEKLLPLTSSLSSPVLAEKTYEPSGEALVDFIAKRFIGATLSQHILESIASEHASRMLAMKNATDNASDLIDDLTLAFNNARQAAITQELAEISAGAQAIN